MCFFLLKTSEQTAHEARCIHDRICSQSLCWTSQLSISSCFMSFRAALTVCLCLLGPHSPLDLFEKWSTDFKRVKTIPGLWRCEKRQICRHSFRNYGNNCSEVSHTVTVPKKGPLDIWVAFVVMLVKAVEQRGKNPGASNNRVELIRGGELGEGEKKGKMRQALIASSQPT